MGQDKGWGVIEPTLVEVIRSCEPPISVAKVGYVQQGMNRFLSLSPSKHCTPMPLLTEQMFYPSQMMGWLHIFYRTSFIESKSGHVSPSQMGSRGNKRNLQHNTAHSTTPFHGFRQIAMPCARHIRCTP